MDHIKRHLGETQEYTEGQDSKQGDVLYISNSLSKYNDFLTGSSTNKTVYCEDDQHAKCHRPVFVSVLPPNYDLT